MSRDVTPDPKPRQRVRLRRRELAQLKVGRYCRICGERAESRHHLVPRSLGGDDVLENLVALCGDGTRGCHGRVEQCDDEARRALRTVLTGAEIDYVIARKGQEFLDSYYPDSEAA